MFQLTMQIIVLFEVKCTLPKLAIENYRHCSSQKNYPQKYSLLNGYNEDNQLYIKYSSMHLVSLHILENRLSTYTFRWAVNKIYFKATKCLRAAL